MKKMAVHSGVFHADEVFGVAMMQGVIQDLEVIRTRDETILATCDIVADVGDGKYDHHQVDKVLREDGIPYSAFGLLWQDFGADYVRTQFPILTDEEQIAGVVHKIAIDFITQIDASDNGVDLNTYQIPITSLSQVISSFMPFDGGAAEVEEGFREAVAFATPFFYKVVRKAVASYENLNMIASILTEQPIEEDHYLVLDKMVGWKEPLLKLDEEERVWYMVYQDLGGSWRVQCVPKEPKSFASRKDLPVEWGGLRGEELTALTGVEGCIFCHPGRFICGNETKEGALALAKLAVEASL